MIWHMVTMPTDLVFVTLSVLRKYWTSKEPSGPYLKYELFLEKNSNTNGI